MIPAVSRRDHPTVAARCVLQNFRGFLIVALEVCPSASRLFREITSGSYGNKAGNDQRPRTRCGDFCCGFRRGLVDPGARRVATTGSLTEALAFKNPDNSIVTLLHNSGSSARTMTVQVRTSYLRFSIPARGFATVNWP
jgi:hypothetical protein